MKICIFGAGAVGGHLAVRLSRAGQDVSVIARGEHLKAIRANGLQLRIGDAKWHAAVQASDDPDHLGAQDVVIVTTKSTGLPQVVRTIAPLLGSRTIVVFAQNGIPWWYGQSRHAGGELEGALRALDPDGQLHRTIDPERVVGAVIFSSNEVLSAGVVHNDSPGANALVVGRPDDTTTPPLAELRAALEASGVASPAPTSIRAAIWQKLQVNLAGSTLCLLLEQPVRALQAHPEMRTLFARLLAEGRAIGAALGDLPTEAMAALLPRAKPDPNHLPSILVDYIARRPMEIDSIVRVPLALGQVLGVPCPVLDTVASIATARAAAIGLYEDRVAG